MADPSHPAGAQNLPYAGLRCQNCDYDLTGASETRCPECGEAFDPTTLCNKPTWWKRPPALWATLSVVLLAVYLPNTWIFWIDYPWGGGYRMHWVRLFPFLPSLLPLALGMQFIGIDNNIDSTTGYFLMSMLTALVVGFGIFVGRRSWLALIIVSGVIFTLQVFNALGCYALFRA